MDFPGSGKAKIVSMCQTMKKSERFPKQIRLRKQVEFDAVYRNKAFAADAVLVIHAVANGQKRTRLGLSVGRKVGNAVARNRWKRTIREAFRRHREMLPEGLDLVVRPRKGATCNYASVVKSLQSLTRRLATKTDLFRLSPGEGE